MDSPACATAAASTQEKTSKIVSEYLKGKDQQWREIYQRKRPLTLLELPIDILQLIVKEITHTNDLTALALTNSALHSLAVPLIYSRFDIVWPDGHIGATESKSVDALTYGLSTLCRENAFARTVGKASHSTARRLAKLTGNKYAKYTRKFSLGNGPSEWVAEYMITKESGKMLGTLVTIAVERMKNLETFIWDMPTGVLTDVFQALGSLADQPDNECKLNRVWIRWHDNSEPPMGASSPVNPNGMPAATALVPQGSQLTAVGIMLPPHASHPPPRPPVSYSEYHCEYPTFSVLPPLKSLTVLDIDEVGYLDEMAVLIERSKDTLQELRVGISIKAAHKDFAQTWDGPGLKQIDHRARWPGESTIGERRLGGVLGILVGKIYDIRKRGPSKAKDKSAAEAAAAEGNSSPATPASTTAQGEGHDPASVNEPSSALDSTGTLQPAVAGTTPQGEAQAKTRCAPKALKPTKPCSGGRKRLEGKLKLHTLELERVVLSLQVCRYAIDWPVLTSLTLLDCAQHDNLWKLLRKQFQPTPIGTGFGISSSSKPPPADAPKQYHLTLKSIHTDATTPSLISFIKETLAPNSLEVLFLQDRKRSSPPLLLDIVFKGAIKQHRSSLRKLLLDSSAKPPLHGTAQPGDNIRWKNWTLSGDTLLYVTSGRMANLRELAVSLEYRDWHTFLQRLPNMPQLRSLNIPHIFEYPAGGFEPRELAHQMVDIITLRPDIRLCYVGIGPKCFEILETGDTPASADSGASGFSTPSMAPPLGANITLNGTTSNNINGASSLGDDEDTTDDDDEDDDDGEEDGDNEEEGGGGEEGNSDGNGDGEGEEEEADDEDDDNTPTTATSDPEETQSDNEALAGQGGAGGATNGEDGEDDDDDGFVEPGSGGLKLRLREILFYDDKVAIFKARHGKL
ncbi:hypothetical protein MFIFM68171_01609 [Madurella fahalii]|uniref:F-box domain-containing protein n=1 Tax=Madurella fahalii TaxID=1157608 RepID=A0ABQ0G166_9PEZI